MFRFADKYGPCRFSSYQVLSALPPALRDQSLHSITGEGPQGKKEPGERAPSIQPWGQAWYYLGGNSYTLNSWVSDRASQEAKLCPFQCPLPSHS